MAIIKIAAPLAGIRGSIGGTTYSANKAGPYARAWNAPPNRRSPFQTFQRNRFAWASETWRDMTVADRALWDAFAANAAQEQTNSLGEAYYLSGHQWFIRCNTRLELMGRAWIDVPPTAGYPADPAVMALTIAQDAFGGQGRIGYTNLFYDTLDLVVALAGSQGVGSILVHSGFHTIGHYQAPGSDRKFFTTELRARFPFVRAGNNYHARTWSQTDEGLRSPGMYDYALAFVA